MDRGSCDCRGAAKKHAENWQASINYSIPTRFDALSDNIAVARRARGKGRQGHPTSRADLRFADCRIGVRKEQHTSSFLNSVVLLVFLNPRLNLRIVSTVLSLPERSRHALGISRRIILSSPPTLSDRGV